MLQSTCYYSLYVTGRSTTYLYDSMTVISSGLTISVLENKTFKLIIPGRLSLVSLEERLEASGTVPIAPSVSPKGLFKGLD